MLSFRRCPRHAVGAMLRMPICAPRVGYSRRAVICLLFTILFITLPVYAYLFYGCAFYTIAGYRSSYRDVYYVDAFAVRHCASITQQRYAIGLRCRRLLRYLISAHAAAATMPPNT